MRILSSRMIGLLLAATAVTPIAVQAQTPPQNGDRDHGEGRGGPPRGEPGQRNEQRRPQPQVQAPQANAPQVQRQQAIAPAAQPDRRADQRGGQGNTGDRGNPGGRPYERRDAGVAGNGADRRDDRRDNRGNWQDNRGGDNRGDNRGGRGDNRRGWNDGRRDDRGEWNRDWRGDRRYGWQDYRSSNRSAFRAPRYIAPRGYGYDYRRWSPGLRIDPWFYGPSYWINDPWDYRLPPAYGDYRWVRYYDDVYLIDIRTGFIQDVIYSFFWR